MDAEITDPMELVQAIDTEARLDDSNVSEACRRSRGRWRLRAIVRDLYDFILAVGPLDEVEDAAVYLKMARKKASKLRRATELYEEIQPEVSGHTNFVMAARSLRTAVDRILSIIKPR